MAGAMLACTATRTPTDPLSTSAALDVGSCRDLYHALDARVEDARVADAQSTRIAGFPYLRIDRFLAADGIRPAVDSDAFEDWVGRLRDLDLEARRFEIRNLSVNAVDALEHRLAQCAELLIASELDSMSARSQLLGAARVPDDYSVAKRVFGLYPFTSLPFKAGVSDFHESMHEAFSAPLASLPVTGRLVRFRPPPTAVSVSAESAAGLLESAAGSPIGIPELTPVVRERLLQAFAPVYEIDVLSDDDRIGTPYWSEDGMPSVDVTRPMVYTRIAYTRFENRTLVQLVYSVWFPSRPPDGDVDLLSGRLDGITFRVTLADDGRPLIYDSMHNCGCYHLFVPTNRLRRKPPSGNHEEPPLVPQWIDAETGRLVLRIAHRSHYLQRIYFDESIDEGDVYAMSDDNTLRSLTTTDGERRSLFAPDGLVIGTERGERTLFWPMGIADPGAMRQWGRHATAFVGTRHFDDPDLIERYFDAVE